VVDPLDAHAVDDLAERPLSCVSGNRAVQDALLARGLDCRPDMPDELFAHSIVHISRNRLQTLARIAAACEATRPGGWVIVDGQKTDGIEAILKKLRSVAKVEGAASRDHGKVFWARRAPQLPEAFAVWRADAQLARNRDGYLTAPGMFSADAIDPGTRLLLDHLPADATGRAVELGAGWGGLAAGVLRAWPALESLDLVEIDHGSIEAARQNISDARACFHWADATVWRGGPYDTVITNPPFHEGRAPEPDLGRAFIRAAAALATPKGRLLMVANRQLPYEQVLGETFRTTRELFANTRYKVILATHPKKPSRRP